MSDERRRTSRTTGGSDARRSRTGPGRGAGNGAAGSSGGAARRPAPATAATATTARPRFTGRAAILVLVLAVLAVSYASSMRAYLEQRAHISDLKEQIADRRVDIDALEGEKKRWKDPAYVRAQARERFGYVKPGETPFVVIDESGNPIESESSLSDPEGVNSEPPDAWFEDAWTSMKIAGNPPKLQEPPLTKIDGSDQATEE